MHPCDHSSRTPPHSVNSTGVPTGSGSRCFALLSWVALTVAWCLVLVWWAASSIYVSGPWFAGIVLLYMYIDSWGPRQEIDWLQCVCMLRQSSRAWYMSVPAALALCVLVLATFTAASVWPLLRRWCSEEVRCWNRHFQQTWNCSEANWDPLSMTSWIGVPYLAKIIQSLRITTFNIVVKSLSSSKNLHMLSSVTRQFLPSVVNMSALTQLQAHVGVMLVSVVVKEVGAAGVVLTWYIFHIILLYCCSDFTARPGQNRDWRVHCMHESAPWWAHVLTGYTSVQSVWG